MWKLQKALKVKCPVPQASTGYKCGQYKFSIACAATATIRHLGTPSSPPTIGLPLHLGARVNATELDGFLRFWERAVFDFITLTNGVAPFKPTPFYFFFVGRFGELSWTGNLNFSLPNSQTYATSHSANAFAVASLCSILFGLARKAHKSCSVVCSLALFSLFSLFYAVHTFISFVKIE